MKLRDGFVSNSSTSSFVICGYKISGENLYQNIIQKLLGITIENIIDKIKKEDYYKDKDIDQKDIESHCSEWLYDIKNEQEGIDFYMPEHVDGILVGITIVDISNGDCEYVEDQEINMAEMQEKLEVIRNRFDIDDIPAKIFTGTTQS